MKARITPGSTCDSARRKTSAMPGDRSRGKSGSAAGSGATFSFTTIFTDGGIAGLDGATGSK